MLITSSASFRHVRFYAFVLVDQRGPVGPMIVTCLWDHPIYLSGVETVSVLERLSYTDKNDLSVVTCPFK